MRYPQIRFIHFDFSHSILLITFISSFLKGRLERKSHNNGTVVFISITEKHKSFHIKTILKQGPPS